MQFALHEPTISPKERKLSSLEKKEAPCCNGFPCDSDVSAYSKEDGFRLASLSTDA